MRSWSSLLLALTLALPVAQALPVLDDPAGDVVADAAGNEQGTGDWPMVDLVAIEVEEQDEAFVFRVQVAAMDETPQDGAVMHVHFRHADREFNVTSFLFPAQPDAIFTDLYARPVGTDAWTLVRGLPSSRDPASDSFSFEVQRGDLADVTGTPPFPGRSLEDFRVLAKSSTTEICFIPSVVNACTPASVHDAMPDDGVAGAVPITIGQAQDGDARLSSSRPVRASNGEATTLVFEVEARNVGGARHEFAVSPRGVPAGWQVHLPATLSLAPGASTSFPVVVETPFMHQHGGTASFLVEMSDGGHVGRVELGLRYLEVPQPSGHHPTLWFHSRADDTLFGAGTVPEEVYAYPYMNALEVDEADQGLGVRGAPNGEVETVFAWCIGLAPALALGIDLDLDTTGRVKVPLHVELPVPAATLGGELRIVDQGPEDENAPYDRCAGRRAYIPIADIDGPTQDIGAMEDVLLEGTLVPLASGDLVPYRPTQSLQLMITLTSGRPAFIADTEGPVLMPGGLVEGPFLEYHDPVDERFVNLDGPRLVVDGAEHRARPGDLFVLPVILENPGAAATFLLTASDGATLVPERVALAAGEQAVVELQVPVPEAARPGDRIDLVVQAAAADDPARAGVLRVLVTADPDAPASTVGTAPEAESPGAAVFLVLAGVGILARRRR